MSDDAICVCPRVCMKTQKIKIRMGVTMPLEICKDVGNKRLLSGESED